ncbi:MAG: glycosyltransferase family 39 protein [Deltaproteobacteria bacterium]|nr:glycosyltransferase family 39 protein [Deltaproteobacteria bacterium]
MSFLARRATGLLALGVFAATFAGVFFYAPQTGYTRDEGFYFDAAEHYAGWFRVLASDPRQAIGEATIRRHFEINREHPVLVKNLMALSYLALAADEPARPAAWPAEQHGLYARAMRLPAHLFAALAACLTFLLGAAVASRRVGLFAALAFILAPRHFYHAQLACFDMPAVAIWLAVILAYRKARGSLAWGVLCGAIWGLALGIKHNSFFIPAILVVHWLIVSGKEFSASRRGVLFPRIPLAFFSMLILGPLVFIVHWPFLWHHTAERIGWYFGFHLHHVHYPWEYFGRLLTEPPFPWFYPFALTALTLPLPTLVLGVWGFFGAAGCRLGRPLRSIGGALLRLAGIYPHRSRSGQDQADYGLDAWDGWMLLLNALVPVLVIAVPSVPIFGGIKHWMHAMPFACLLGGLALERMLAALPARWLRRARPRSAARARHPVFALAAALALLPSLLGLIHLGPYGSSFYNELAGGVAGAAELGMQRQYWSNNVTGVLPFINDNLPPKARLYLHEVTGESIRAYKRDGLLRPDIRTAWSPQTADFIAYQVHREFADVEYQAWHEAGHARILHGLYIDEVPIVLVYDLRAEPQDGDP